MLEKFGRVGEIEKVSNEMITMFLDKNIIPVISPVCCNRDGLELNVNADNVAFAIAKALKSEKMIFLSDVDGVYRDRNDKSSVISAISVSDIDEMIKNGTISGGMIPKMKSCREALEVGIKNVHIINGNVKHAMLLEIFTKNGIGTILSGF